MTSRSPKPKPASGRKVRLKPANPFDLIRLIAHSQSDARKALAELVQNSLDADASQVLVSRQRRRGEVTLSVSDNGRGIFPDLPRPDALERIATNIGHSFKRNLSVAERQRQMLLGKYGIGILGFWCVGQELEIRSQVAGSEVWQLRLVRDEPMAEVRSVKQTRIPFDGDTWTEFTIRHVHASPARQLSARRLGEYLGAELRGQLLTRDVKLRMIDRLARTAALKDFLVVPQRFEGRRLPQFGELAVPGWPRALLELYLLDPEAESRSRVALTCGGTVVCDDLAAVEGHELARDLWGWDRLEGIVEFPALDVAPSTRRGFSPSPSADALFAALATLEPELGDLFKSEHEKRSEQLDEHLAREIRSVFRPLVASLPQYDFFEITTLRDNLLGTKKPGSAQVGHTETAPATGTDILAGDAAAGDAIPGAAMRAEESDPPSVTEIVDADDAPAPPLQLFAPGPLQSVRLVPAKSRLLPGASRSLAAKAADADGHPVTEGVVFAWRIVEGLALIEASETHAVLSAGSQLGRVRVTVTAQQGEITCAGSAEIEVVPKLAGDNPDAGIPDPERAFDPNGDWRSRVVNGRWEYNAAHPDYRAVADDNKQRLRYLVHLFAKEIVLHNYGEAKDERLLERLVEVLTHIKSRGT